MKIPISQKFEEMTKLYHFTSFDAACEIIESGKLRFGKMFKMNDLIESNRIVFGRVLLENLSDKELFAEDEMNRYQQVSFTQDQERDGIDYFGFDLHTMWGLYADKGFGTCLVFDKRCLHLQDNDFCKEVIYRNFIPKDYQINNKSKTGIRSEIWRRKEEIFFYKRKEWEYEQEFRIIRRVKNKDDDEYMDVSDALSFVIISKDETVETGESIWDGVQCYVLKHLKRRIPVLSYEYDLDGYTLYRDEYGDPIWAEQIGYY